MTRDEKIIYTRMALSIHGLNVDIKHVDIFIQTYEKVCQLKVDFSLKDAAEISTEVESRHSDAEQ